MLKPKTAQEELASSRSKLLSASEIRRIYSNDNAVCCSNKCVNKLILNLVERSKGPANSNVSNADTSISSSSGTEIANFIYCQQIGIPTSSIPSNPFDQFLEEVRQPFYKFQVGATSEAEINEQLRYYLVQKFTENRIADSENKQNQTYIYQLSSLSRGLITVCKSAYIHITGISNQAIEYAQRLVRKKKSAEAILLAGGHDQSTAKSLKEAFGRFNLDYNLYEQNINNFVDVTKIPDSSTAFMCVAFLAEWFELAAEQEPNADEIHIDPINQSEVWEDYRTDAYVLSEGGSPYEYSAFTKIWRNVFPKVKMREYKNVTGKCEICDACKRMMAESKSKAMRIVVRQYKLMHRAFYMGEKLLYYQRRAEAANSNGEIGSIIIDKMGTHSTQLPILANLNSPNSLFPVAVTGAISHGRNETTFYLSTPNVSTGASYTIHCIFSELKKLYDQNNHRPLKKVYIEIDGASDNVAKAVIAACEHLVLKKYCPFIVLARLPVGHTHEDIDSRFGKIHTYIREKHVSTFEEFCSRIKEAFGKSVEVFVKLVFAIYDYKEYYDQFIDKQLVDKYSRLDVTQLYFKIQPVRECDLGDGNTSNILVRTNYRKFGPDYTVFLRENFDEEFSTDLPYQPVLLKSAWMPENAINVSCLFPESCNSQCLCRERAPGISFLSSVPMGRPNHMQFEKGWFNNFSAFVEKISEFFRKRKEDRSAEYWQAFAKNQMPQSELVSDYVTTHDVNSPLGQFLFHTARFGSDEKLQAAITAENNALTGFSCNSHRLRASVFDLDLMEHIAQNKQSIPWKGHRSVFKNWVFDRACILQRILLTRGTGERKRTQKGTCTAWCDADINEGPLHQIVFDDRSAPTTLSPAQFRLARLAYLALPEVHTGVNFEPPRRTVQRRAQATTRGGDANNSNNNSNNNNNTNSTNTIGLDAANFPNGYNPGIDQTANSRTTTCADPVAATTSATTFTTTAACSSTSSGGVVGGGRSGSSSGSSGGGAAAAASAAVVNCRSSSIITTNATGSRSSSAATIVGCNSSTTAATTATPTAAAVTDISLQNNASNSLRPTLCCSIPDCSEHCTVDAPICLECPPSKRCFLYCSLHSLHSVHKDQSSTRRNNSEVYPDLNTTTNNNNTLSTKVSATSCNNTGSSLLNARGSIGRRKRTRFDGDEEECMCGCGKIYEKTTMSDCKGSTCTNRVHRTCVPNTWLCNLCKLKINV